MDTERLLYIQNHCRFPFPFLSGQVETVEGDGFHIRTQAVNLRIDGLTDRPCFEFGGFASALFPLNPTVLDSQQQALGVDVARAYGYDNVVPVRPDIASPAGEEPLEVFSRGLRNFMVGFGLQEVLTFMMSNREKLFTRMGLPEEPIAETSNPKMDAYDSLRNRLIPSLLEVLTHNKHHPYPQNIYELDDVVLIDPSTETGARSTRRLAVIICHAKANFSETKAMLNAVMENLDLPVEIREGGWGCFIEGRRFTATHDGTPVCWAGEVKPEVLLDWDIEMPVTALEMDIEHLFRVLHP